MISRLTTLSYCVHAGVANITLDRASHGNRVNEILAAELSEVCADVEAQLDVVVTLLSGAGDSFFCAGTDTAHALADSHDRGAVGLPRVASCIAGLRMPTVCLLNGDAINQGLELALACDIRVAVDHARMALSISDDCLPWDGGTQRLPRVIGSSRALEMLLTGRTVNAQEALRMGLVGQVVHKHELSETGQMIARSIASKAPWAVRFAKEAILEGLDVSLLQGLHLEADLYFLLQTTEDRIEGIRAFQQKRPPHFMGE